MNKKTIVASLMTGLTLTAALSPILANADALSGDNTTYHVTNSQILSKISETNPEVYSKIPDNVKNSMQQSGVLQQGTTKIVTTKTGFKIYQNSAIVKTIKYGGIGVATATLTAIGITVTAATFGLGTAAIVAVSASVLAACNNMSASRGVIVSFSNKGAWISTQSQ